MMCCRKVDELDFGTYTRLVPHIDQNGEFLFISLDLVSRSGIGSLSYAFSKKERAAK